MVPLIFLIQYIEDDCGICHIEYVDRICGRLSVLMFNSSLIKILSAVLFEF